MKAYPFLFNSIYKDYIWGGQRIIHKYQRKTKLNPCAESWEISSHQDGMSEIKNGLLAGISLKEALEEIGLRKTLGYRCQKNTFPLLFKIIDAKETLSVQVHPNDTTASLYGGEAKSEMWVVLDAQDRACVYTGLKEKVTKQDFISAIKKKTVEELLNKVSIKRGDVINIPAGRVHAIGAGCMLYEIQQNSNTTYRIYDWDRVDKNGKSRELHLDQAMKVIQFEATEAPLVEKKLIASSKGKIHYRLNTTDKFVVDMINLKSPLMLRPNCSTFYALFNINDPIMLTTKDGEIMLRTGESCMIPANCGEVKISPLEEASFLLTYLP